MLSGTRGLQGEVRGEVEVRGDEGTSEGRGGGGGGDIHELGFRVGVG